MRFVIHRLQNVIRRIAISVPVKSMYVCLIKTNNMETNTSTPNDSTNYTIHTCEAPRKTRLGKVLGGTVLVLIGALLFARNAGAPLPEWLFSFGSLVFVLGLFTWVRHSFRRPGGLLFMLIGALIVISKMVTGLAIAPFFWPIAIIAMGAWMILKPQRKHHRWAAHHMYASQKWECRNPQH